MSRDENVYSEPEEFDPTCYLFQPHGKGEPLFTTAWGFGRRSLARDGVYTRYGGELTCRGQEWKGRLPEIAFTDGLISKAVPFDCQVQIRSEAAKAVLAQIEI